MRSPWLAVAASLVTLLAMGAPAGAKTEIENLILALAASDDEVWAWVNDYRLLRVDAGTMRVTHRAGTLPGALLDLAVGEGGCGAPGRADAYGVTTVSSCASIRLRGSARGRSPVSA